MGKIDLLVHILVSPGLYQFVRNIQPCSFIRNIHPCSFLETFTPTRLLDTYSPLLVYYISRKIPAYSLIRAYSFIRELRVRKKIIPLFWSKLFFSLNAQPEVQILIRLNMCLRYVSRPKNSFIHCRGVFFPSFYFFPFFQSRAVGRSENLVGWGTSNNSIFLGIMWRITPPLPPTPQPAPDSDGLLQSARESH